jgi:DNA repair exonuclease SbcCD ATPase subunit
LPDLASVADLYTLPLDDFTTARNELAARLRKSGDRAAADQVKALPKPSITAWALNQVARRHRNLVDSLLASANELRSAQQQLLAGRNSAGFRAATQHERQAVTAIVRAAANVLAEDGHPPSKTTLDRLEASASAAAADADHGELLRAGRLVRDLDPSGFGGLSTEAFGFPSEPIPFPSRSKPAAGSASRHPGPRPVGPAPSARQQGPSLSDQAEIAAARDAVRELQRQLATLRKEASDAERSAASARQAASKADRMLADAREAVEQAEKDSDRAHRVQEEASQDLASLRARIDATAGQLEAAEEAVRALRRV